MNDPRVIQAVEELTKEEAHRLVVEAAKYNTPEAERVFEVLLTKSFSFSNTADEVDNLSESLRVAIETVSLDPSEDVEDDFSFFNSILNR